MAEQSLLHKLRERRVFRSAGYYVLAGWLLLQVGDVISEPAGLPPWTMTALLYILICGFPVALLFGWRYDITEHGLVRTTGEGEYDPDLMRLKPVDYVIICLLLSVLGFAVYRALPVAQQAAETSLPAPAAPAVRQGSVAVLPFADLSQGKDQEFLGDGISDTVMHVLAQVEGLDVTARTSSFAFKNSNLGIPEIARSLGVAHILEGSVQRAGEQVRIIARLIDTRAGTEVWSGYYDRDYDAVFAIQDEIAQEVTTALMVKVLHTEDVQVDRGYQPDLAAFEQLILGREALERGTGAGAAEAYERFQSAVATDPDYALAHAMLASAIPANATALDLSRSEVVERSMAHVAKALDLDPLLPEAHAGKAQLYLATKDFDAAMKSANRALELRPSYADAYSALTDIYITQSRFDEALVTARKAAELDPEDNEYQQELARVLWSLGRSEAAIDVVREAIARKPKLPFNYITLARYLLQTGHSGEAQYWTGRALELDPESQNLQFNYCLGLLQFWAVEEARTCLRGFLEEYPGNPEATNYLAHLTGDIELGLSNGRRQVEQNPDFWYRKMQLADWLVRAEAYEDLLALFREAFPALYADPPEVNDMTVWAARNVVQALQGLGREEDARKLIVAGLKHLGRQRKLQGTHLATGIDDVYFLAYAGEYDRAITRLREAIDRDWQFYSFGLLIPADLPQSFVEDPRFQEQVERLGKIMAEERAWYEENKGRNLSPSAMTTL